MKQVFAEEAWEDYLYWQKTRQTDGGADQQANP